MRGVSVAALVCLCVLGACQAKETQHVGIAPTEVSLSELASRIGFELPPHTELLGSSKENGIDEAVLAKVVIRVDEWPEFLKHAALSDADFVESKRYLLGNNNGWWDPERAAVLPTAQTEVAAGRYLNVGVDRSGPGRIVLYLMWHET